MLMMWQITFVSILEVASYRCFDGSVHKELPSGSGLTISSLCLDAPIAGAVGEGWVARSIIRGPSPMHAIADPNQDGIIYFSWSEDLPFADSEDGRIHVVKMRLRDNAQAEVMAATAFDGYVRSGGMDITEDGVLGTLCAKYVPEWVEEFMQSCNLSEPWRSGAAPMMLAVCEVNATTLQAIGKPWRIGKQWGTGETHSNGYTFGGWGNHPVTGHEYGSLTYASKHKMWHTWYEATVCSHSGYAMHTYKENAPRDNTSWPLPVAGVEYREETLQPSGWSYGTGDHQAGSAIRYHPLLGDMAIQKHIDGIGFVYMQQYGFEAREGHFSPEDNDGKVPLEIKNETHTIDRAIYEGSIRPCGLDWISAFITEQGNVCAKISRQGVILKWKLIGSRPSLCGWCPTGVTRLAPLGSQESQARCGSDARFLMGYEDKDQKKWLVELDGECEVREEAVDVNDLVTWPNKQEWTTTKDGAVSWVTAWKNHPSELHIWQTRMRDGTSEEWRDPNNKGYLRTPEAHNEARVITYWPKWRPDGTMRTPAPTTTPPSAPEDPEYLTLFQHGSFGSQQLNESEFNKCFWEAGTGIMRRSCNPCPMEEVFIRVYPRSPTDWNAYQELLVTWSASGFRSTFDIFMSLEDAFAGQNPWTYCNGNDPGIGFPRDCGPTGPQSYQWTSFTHGGLQHYMWSVLIARTTSSTTIASVPTTTTTTGSATSHFSAVDGGIDRACRGVDASDNSVAYYQVFQAQSLMQCKSLCMEQANCKGIEHHNGGRCEVWTRDAGIGATIRVSGFKCLRYEAQTASTFVPVDGGHDRACRGSNYSDNSDTYYTLFPGITSLDACKELCVKDALCRGIEFKIGRCEVWTRDAGIGATTGFSGFTCLRHVPNMLRVPKLKEARRHGFLAMIQNSSALGKMIAPQAPAMLEEL